MTNGELGFDQGVPDPIRLCFVARWLQGAASIEWLINNWEWFEWADICSLAFEQAQAEINKQPES